MDLGLSGKDRACNRRKHRHWPRHQEFAQNGMPGAIVARNAEHLRTTAEQIASQFKTEVLPLAANVANPAEPAWVVNSAAERFGSLDILVNNAGRAHTGGILNASDTDWQDMTDTKLSAMRRFCLAAIPT